jgi:hypothetical protein
VTVESVGKDAIQRVLATGTPIHVSRIERGVNQPRPGVVEGWNGGGRCRLMLTLDPHDPLPQEGERVRLGTSRVDGLFQTAGTLHDVAQSDRAAVPRLVEAALRPDYATATRLQRRAFFRLAGRWQVLVSVLRAPHGAPGPGGEPAGETSFPAIAHDLSAGGMLLGQPAWESFDLGTHLRVSIDLNDGNPPLAATAEVVRHQAAPASGGSRCCGCRFQDLSEADERRILRALHALYRARIRQTAAPTPASSETV